MSGNGKRTLMGITQSAFDPASRVRFIQYMPLLEQSGWRVSHRPNRPDRQWRSRLPNRVAGGVPYRAGRALLHGHRRATTHRRTGARYDRASRFTCRRS
jgi:hypothetical protein